MAWGGDRKSPEAKKRLAELREKQTPEEKATRRKARRAAKEAQQATEPAKPATEVASVPAQPKARPVDLDHLQALIELYGNSRHGKKQRRTQALNPFKLPAFPKQAMPPKKADQMAMDSFPDFNWASQAWMAGAVFNGMSAEGLTFPGYAYLSELAQRAEYRILSETIADDATRRWIKFEVTGSSDPMEQKRRREAGDDPKDDSADDPDESEKKIKDAGKLDKVKALRDYLDLLDARDVFYRLCRDEGYFGRMHLFFQIGDNGVDDGNDPELKMPIGNSRDAFSQGKVSHANPLKAIKTLEPVWCYPQMYNARNPLAPNYYNPEQWYVLGKEVHVSRLIPVVSRPVPDLLKPAYSFGGLAMSQIAEPYVNIWLETQRSVADMIRAFSVFVLESDLNVLTQAGGAGGLIARAMEFNLLRDNHGLMLINKATEGFQNVAAPLGGLSDLQAQAQEHVASIARIPLVKYTGLQPKGLNASNEGEIAVYDDTIGAYQNRTIRPTLTRVINFAQLSMWGEIDPEITFTFEKLREISQKELGDKQKADADRDQIYINIGALAPEEVRKRVIDDPELPYADLDPDDVPDLEQEEAQGLEPEGGRPQVQAENDNAKAKGKEAAGQDAEDPFEIGAGSAPTRVNRGEKRQAADADFVESQHPRNEGGEFAAGGGAAKALSAAAPALKHFKHIGPRPERYSKGRTIPADPHHHIMASTEVGQAYGKQTVGNPITIPGHKTATGIALKVNEKTKHIHFSELNSHIKGAGKAMVEAIIKKYPDYKFSVSDLSGVSQGENRNEQTFWEKMLGKYPDRFTSDQAMDAEFNEADHPRAPDGKFGEGNGGKSSKSAGSTARTKSVTVPMSDRKHADLKTQFVDHLANGGKERIADVPLSKIKATQDTVNAEGPAPGAEGDAPIVGIMDSSGNLHVINGHHRIEQAKAAGKTSIKARVVDDKATEPDKSTESSTEAGDPQVEFKTKKEHAGHLLERGTTAKELMETLGWPSISVPATARSLGMNLTKVKEGRITKYVGTPMTAAERKAANLPPEGIKRSGGPASRPPHTFSLLQYIASRGGIDPRDPLIGDVRSVFGTKNLFVPGFGSLIRPNGMKLDTLREAVVEAGYIQDKGFNNQNVEETSTIRDLLDAMDTENRGDRIYQYGQAPESEQAKQQEHVDEENLRHHDEQLDDALDYAGIDRNSVDGPQRSRVLEIMLREGITDPLEALEQEAMEWVTHASETGEVNRLLDTIPGWDVPAHPDPAPHSGRTNAPVERP